MHPRNPYRTRPDFAQLAEAYPPLKPCLIEVGTSFTLDFKNEVSQRRLTEALLHRDFGLTVQRLNYILWIEDIVNALGLQSERVYGLDIGTGASAIYPLLGCKTNTGWTFLATDIDFFSLQSARNNIERNDLQERVRLFQTTAEAPIFAPLHQDPALSVTFAMCNPPFYSSHDDVKNSAEAKEFEPNAVCTGADVEMITPGGEVAFVRRMLEESVRIGTRCRWYTSMLGKMESLSEVVRTLREHSIDNYAITEFVQGTTRRWAIGWSLTKSRLPDAIHCKNPDAPPALPHASEKHRSTTFHGVSAVRVFDRRSESGPRPRRRIADCS
ncbi:S-adenosyl-L-methionine-dependent methyltransferase [Mycena chlorophos]|uniref:S-adenosyl-L-methionine-dependent methyltransferase n=1 Tax=Mycena chlorophos TaxID=658473 RepID=A0A8H6WNU2_MYCCL|nr:S-adenosyl-L-methionine-dependent methyltransferase [Mycena chlorophos]